MCRKNPCLRASAYDDFDFVNDKNASLQILRTGKRVLHYVGKLLSINDLRLYILKAKYNCQL